jgi:hypothetical protein
MRRSNLEKKEFCQHQRRHGHNQTNSKKKRKNQYLFVILKEESDEDLAIFEG